MKTSIIIQARLGSKRLPNKILKKINNKSIIELIYKRLLKSRKADEIVFAIPKNKGNLKLKKFITKELKAKVFIGPEHNVLKRYYMAAKKFKSDIIVRITSDCPLVDPKIVDNYIDILKKKKLDYVYNGFPHTYPDGFDVEVFNFKSLNLANKYSKSEIQREGVTRFFRDNIKKFKTQHVSSPIKNISKLRVTLDEESDFDLIKNIFNYFKPNIHFNWREVVKLSKMKKKLFKINSHIKINEGGYLDDNQKLWKRAKSIIPGGNSLLSKNPDGLLPGGWPTYYSKAKKIFIWDLTKKKYTDVCTMGVGTNILGYANTQIDNKVKHFINCGNISTLNSPEEVQLAEKLIDLHPGLDMARFARTGGEANAIAIRIARASQNKNKHKIAICGYHGWHDWYLSSNLDNQKNLDKHLITSLKPNGVPNFLKNTCFAFEYGDYKKFNQIIKTKNIGIIIMEVSRNKLLNKKFLNHVRDVSKKKGAILIFDECTSGFRETLGGIYKKINIQPDMIVLGKALGNGYPITAVLGKKEIMSHAKQTFISSTFWTERLGPVAALKTIEIMEKLKSWEIITKTGKYLNNKWLKIAKENDLELIINGLPSISKFEIKSKDFQAYKTFITQEMLKKGFLASNSVYLSIYHEKKVLDSYLDKLNDLFKVIKKCENKEENILELLSYPISKKPFKRLN
jgi:glutamate-1-semialdehyde 2,1-aminomutase